MERRGRIPVAKFRTQEAKTRSRSRVREPDYNEQDPETDLFTLLEDNIALKEENKSLKVQIDEKNQLHNKQLEENNKLLQEIENLKKEHGSFENIIKDLTKKNREFEMDALNKINEMHLDQMNLNEELKILKSQESHKKANIIESRTLKSKILKILPDIQSKNNDLESLMEIESSESLNISSDLVESLVEGFIALKSSMGVVELQLYEANEKISELIENQHHLDEENENLRNENSNLTKVAKLLTENMKESVETSKKMEAALIKLKQRNDELTARSRDQFDGQTSPLPNTSPSPTTLAANAEFDQLQHEVEQQNEDHNERIVEMKKLMEAAIEKNTNDELKTIQIKLDIMEEELRKALARADFAEKELKKYRERNDGFSSTSENSFYTSSASQNDFNILPSSQLNDKKLASTPLPQPPLPPPPPPPLPAKLLYKPANLSINKSKPSGSKIIDNVKNRVEAEVATGVDALVRELKSGTISLRRSRPRSQTNQALEEMFQVLEISQTQNRSSRICIDWHL